MKKDQFTKYHKKLQELRQEITGQGAASIKAEKSGLAHEILDEDIQPLSEMTQAIASSRNLTRSTSLIKIDAALNRLKNTPDEFGLCEDCGEKIPPKRLELIPFAELCAPCQGERDDANNASKSMRRRHLTDYK